MVFFLKAAPKLLPKCPVSEILCQIASQLIQDAAKDSLKKQRAGDSVPLQMSPMEERIQQGQQGVTEFQRGLHGSPGCWAKGRGILSLLKGEGRA